MKDIHAEAEQDKDVTTVGGRIRYARKSQGKTQQEVADALPDMPGRKKSRASIAQYEMGNPPGLDVLIDLAAVLGESPCYLAFGDEAAGRTRPPQGERIPINPSDDQMDDEGYAFLPQYLLSELGAASGRLIFTRLEVDAPTFGLRKQHYLLLDASSTDIKSDGQLYAVRSSAGLTIVRSEPTLSREEDGWLMLTGGSGANYRIHHSSLEVVGLILASLSGLFTENSKVC
jgi:transcriptional regulator with XRE-family HTH domain